MDLIIELKILSSSDIKIQVFCANHGALYFRYYPKLTPEVSLDIFINRIMKEHIHAKFSRST